MTPTKFVALLALILSGNAWAHDEAAGHTHWWLELDASWYAGVGLGQSSFKEGLNTIDDGSLGSSQRDDSDIGMRLFGGAGFGRYFAVELGYADFGEGSSRAQSDGSGTFWNAGPTFASSKNCSATRVFPPRRFIRM